MEDTIDKFDSSFGQDLLSERGIFSGQRFHWGMMLDGSMAAKTHSKLMLVHTKI